MHAEQCRLQQLGVSAYSSMFARTASICRERNKTNQRNRDDSESDYDPSQDDTGEADLIDDDIAKVLIIPSC
jgi:hypothetical protein